MAPVAVEVPQERAAVVLVTDPQVAVAGTVAGLFTTTEAEAVQVEKRLLL